MAANNYFIRALYQTTFASVLIISFACQNKDKKKELSPIELEIFSGFLPDEKPKVHILDNQSYQFFKKVKDEFGLSLTESKYTHIDFMALSRLFSKENGYQFLEKRYYLENGMQSITHKLGFKSNRLATVNSEGDNHSKEMIFKYDDWNRLIEVLESHKYPDLIANNQNKISQIKGKHSITRTSFNYNENNLTRIVYDEIFEDEKRKMNIDSFYYLKIKSDLSLNLVREVNFNHIDDFWNQPSNFNHMIFKDGKLIKVIEFNRDSTVYGLYELNYSSERNIQIDYFKRNDLNLLVHRYTINVEIDSGFNIQNMIYLNHYNEIQEISEKQFVYLYDVNVLKNINVSNREYTSDGNNKEELIPDFKKAYEIIVLE